MTDNPDHPKPALGTVRRHQGWVVGTLSALLGAAGLVAWLQPDVHEFARDAGIYGVLVSLALALVVVGLVNALWRRDDTIAALKSGHTADLARLNDRHAADAALLADKNQALAKEVARLEAVVIRPQPTARDQELGANVLSIWDLQGPVCRFLEFGFIGKQWLGTDTEPIYSYVDRTEHRYFDDQETQAAFTSLQSAIQAMCHWFGYEGGADAENNRDRARGEPLIFTIRSPRVIGYPEYDRIRREGEKLAGEVLEAAQQFERVARARGL